MREKGGERTRGRGLGFEWKRTAVLAGDEVDVLPELDVEAGVAHEVLHPDAGDRPRHRRSGASSPAVPKRRRRFGGFREVGLGFCFFFERI